MRVSRLYASACARQTYRHSIKLRKATPKTAPKSTAKTLRGRRLDASRRLLFQSFKLLPDFHAISVNRPDCLFVPLRQCVLLPLSPLSLGFGLGSPCPCLFRPGGRSSRCEEIGIPCGSAHHDKASKARARNTSIVTDYAYPTCGRISAVLPEAEATAKQGQKQRHRLSKGRWPDAVERHRRDRGRPLKGAGAVNRKNAPLACPPRRSGSR